MRDIAQRLYLSMCLSLRQAFQTSLTLQWCILHAHAERFKTL